VHAIRDKMTRNGVSSEPATPVLETLDHTARRGVSLSDVTTRPARLPCGGFIVVDEERGFAERFSRSGVLRLWQQRGREAE
jgi:hypothetical protein